MGTPVEQINADYTITVAEDAPIRSAKEIYKLFSDSINNGELDIKTWESVKYVEYSFADKKVALLYANVTYLGNPWELYLKRIQIKPSWKQFCDCHLGWDIRYFGIYHNGPLTLFVDFVKETYLSKKGHNSAAHVHTGDLYLGLRRGYFSKIDARLNEIRVIRSDRLEDYLVGKDIEPADLLVIPKKFVEYLKSLVYFNPLNINEEFEKFISTNAFDKEIGYIPICERKYSKEINLKFFKEDYFGTILTSNCNRWVVSSDFVRNISILVKNYGKLWLFLWNNINMEISHIEINPVNIKYIKFNGNTIASYKSQFPKQLYLIKEDVENFIIFDKKV